MRDITRPESPKYPLKDYGIDLLIAVIPTGIAVALLNTMGISGALIPIVSILCFMYIAKRIRKGKSWSRSKTFWITLLAYLLIFAVLPMLLISFL